jgi:HicB family.
MSKAMSVRLPKYLHREIKKLAEEEGISMNQFIATAAAEKGLLAQDGRVPGKASRGGKPRRLRARAVEGPR